MRSLTVAVTALVVVATAVVAPVTSVATASASHSVPAMTSRSASIAYPGCPAGAVSVTVATPRDPVPAGQTVHYDVSLRNNRPTACGPPQATTTVTGGAGLRSILVNPCSELRVVIDDHRGEQVYPPFEAIMCPLLLPPKLAGVTTVVASLGWNQVVGGGGRPARRAHLAPRGSYRVLVDNAVRAPFVLAPARPSSAGRRTLAHPTASIVTRRGHVAFEGCPAKQLVATVSVPARPYVGALVSYVVRLTNVGMTECGPSASVMGPPGPQMLTVGACGILPAVVRNAAGINVFPGRVAFSCPAETFVDIPAHTSVTATGNWPGAQQRLGPGPVQVSAAPPGRYRIVVGEGSSVVSVPFTLVAAPASTPGSHT